MGYTGESDSSAGGYQLAWYALESDAALPDGDVDDQRPAFRCVALSLGNRNDPVFAAFVEGTKGGVTSQIGSQLGIDAMAAEAIQLVERVRARAGSSPQFVQTAFREANKQLYQYGTKMLSGGKIAAGGLVLCYDGQKVSIGRTSVYQAYLCRDGQLAEFFGKEIASDPPVGSGAMERYLGTSKQVLVDIASLNIVKGDRVFLSSIPLTNSQLQELMQWLRSASEENSSIVQGFAARLVRDVPQKGEQGRSIVQRNVYCALLTA